MASEERIVLFTLLILAFYNRIAISEAQSVTASFSTNPVDDDTTALFTCRIYNLGSNVVTIERTIFSATQQLVYGTEFLSNVDDNFFLSVFSNDDGSKTYLMTIRGVYHLFDAGTYTCKIIAGGSVIAEQSVILNINYTPGSSDPRCSIVGSSENLSRMPGSEVRLGCHSAIGYPPVDIAWSYKGCNNRALPQPTLSNSGAYYSELRVTLTEEDNGGIFTCTISRPDGSFSNSCFRGPFEVQGGSVCDPSNALPVTSAPHQHTTLSNVLNEASVTASFQTNPVYEGSTATFICQVYNLGSNFVYIERTISSTTATISVGTQVLLDANDLVLSVRNNNDGSQTYTLTISDVTPQQDAGVYTCKVQTYQNLILATQSASLQINAIIVNTTPAPVYPSITASFQQTPVNEGTSAVLLCQVYNLGSNHVSIERTISSTTEQLSIGTQLQSGFTDDFRLYVRVNNDGSQTYTMTILTVNREQDAGTYTCNVRSSQNQVLVRHSSYLQIIEIILTTIPAPIIPSVTTSFQTSTVDEGSAANFVCQVYNLGSNYVSIERTISSTTEQLSLGTQVLPAFINDWLLSVRFNNDGSQTYTMTNHAVNFEQDAGTYTCNVRSSQNQVLVRHSSYLQIIEIILTTISAPINPSVTTSFQTSPVDEGSAANFVCQVYNLGSNYVSIERTISSTIEQLSTGHQLQFGFTDDFRLSVRGNNDGSQTFTMTILAVNREQDAGTYTCNVRSPQNQVLVTHSSILQIIEIILTTAPAPIIPSVTTSFQTSPVDERSDVNFVCQVHNLGSNYVSIERIISSTTEQLSLGTQVLPAFTNGLLLSVRVNNDGSQTYTMTILSVNREQDAGTYTCNVRSSQSQVLATDSSYLQINTIIVSTTPTPVYPSITASFQQNFVYEGSAAVLACQVYNLGSNHVSIERTISSTTEQLSTGTQLRLGFTDDFRLYVLGNNDGSQTYTMTILTVNREQDAGTYTCNVRSSQSQVLATQSAYLQINAITVSTTPTPVYPSITASFQPNPVDEGSATNFVCQVHNLGSNYVSIERIISSTTEQLSLGTQVLPAFIGDWILSVGLNNDGSQTYMMKNLAVNRDQDAGTYTCNVRSSQSQVLATQSAYLQINAITVSTTPTPVYPSITASFQQNLVDEGSAAVLVCQVYDLGSNHVSIERTISSTTEQLSIRIEVHSGFTDKFRLSVRGNNDGSQTYTMTILTVNREQDAGTYTCNVRSSQSQVLATDSSYLQINAIVVPTTPTPVYPSITASFQQNLVYEGSAAVLACQVYNLGSNHVSIERTISSTTEQLSTGTQLRFGFTDDFRLYVLGNNDGSQTYTMTILTVNREQDAGTYTCNVRSSQSQVLATQSAYLQINAITVSTTPTPVYPSITASFQPNPVDEGSATNFVCQVHNLGSNYVSIERIISSTTEQLSLGTQVLPAFIGDWILSVGLKNDGSQTYMMKNLAVNRDQDAGTYTCNVRSSQSQVLATQSAYLQINAITVSTTPTPVYPSITASFQQNLVDEGSAAVLVCQVYDLGSNHVSIERTISSTTEQLSIRIEVHSGFTDKFRLSVRGNNDGSQTYTMTILTVNREQDAGTYTCNVRSSQSQVLATDSSYLQINAIVVPTTPTPVYPSITASFQQNLVYEGSAAVLACQVYNLGSNHVSIERTISSTTEQLSTGTQLRFGFTDDFRLYVLGNNDGSQTYTMTILTVNREQDAGTYTCNVRSSQSQVLATQSAYLQINAITVSTTPTPVYPSITASFQPNPVDEGSATNFVCQVHNLGSNYVSIERIISSTTEQLSLGTQVLPAFIGDWILSVGLKNDGSQTYMMKNLAVNRDQDAGTYTCNVRSSQSQVLATQSAYLQINAITVSTTPTPVYPSITASFQQNIVDEGSAAVLVCQVYDLGSNHVSIERTISSTTEQLSIRIEVHSGFTDKFRLSVRGNNDGSQTYTMTILTVNREQDAGTYTCNVRSSQSQVLATDSSYLQINAIVVPTTPTPVYPSITASFQQNLVYEGSAAVLACQVYNLGSNHVSIERTISSTTEQLSTGTQLRFGFTDDFRLYVLGNNDGSQTYTMTILTVNREQDAGTYTCNVRSSQSQVLATQSAYLQINAITVSTTPTPVYPSITASFQPNPVDEGSATNFVCQVHNLGSNYVSIERIISSTTEQLSLGTQVLPAFMGDWLLSVGLKNDGSHTYMMKNLAVNRDQDAGTYTCNVRSSQSQVLATESAYLQINAITVSTTPTPVYPSITASFQQNLVDEGSAAVLVCQVYDLGSNHVSIERTISSTTEQLSIRIEVHSGFTDKFRLSVRGNNDGSQTYTMTILTVNREQDSGTYTCNVRSSQSQVLATDSSYLQINAIVVPTTPTPVYPSITASFQQNLVDEGSAAVLVCQVYYLGSNHVSIERTISSIPEQLSTGTELLSGFDDFMLSVRVNSDRSESYMMTILTVKRQQDAGTYTCKVQSPQSQVLAVQSAYLQVNAIIVTTSPAPVNPSVTASFQQNPVDEGGAAILKCQVNNLGSNFVSIERTTSAKTQSLTISTVVFQNVTDKMSLSVQNANDGSQEYTLTINQVNRQHDAGTYTCKVETLQRQVLVMQSAVLQINTIALPTTPSTGLSDLYVTVSFQSNPVDEGASTLLICQVYNLESNIVFIERTRYSRTEQLSKGAEIFPDVDDYFFLFVQDYSDGSKAYTMTIRGVYHDSDAGTYTCKVGTPQGRLLAQQSTVLNINYDPISADPRCSIVGSSQDLTRLPGSEVRLGCHSELGYPPVDISWSYSGCNNNRHVLQPTTTNSKAYYSELRVILSGEDNGGVFVCTINRPDGSFSSSCFRGPFVIPGGTECSPVTETPSSIPESTLPIKPTESMTITKGDVGGPNKGAIDRNNSCNILIPNNTVQVFSLSVFLGLRFLLWK